MVRAQATGFPDRAPRVRARRRNTEHIDGSQHPNNRFALRICWRQAFLKMKVVATPAARLEFGIRLQRQVELSVLRRRGPAFDAARFCCASFTASSSFALVQYSFSCSPSLTELLRRLCCLLTRFRVQASFRSYIKSCAVSIHSLWRAASSAAIAQQHASRNTVAFFMQISYGKD